MFVKNSAQILFIFEKFIKFNMINVEKISFFLEIKV